jgi:NADPH-dependent curcumin reductase CurA
MIGGTVGEVAASRSPAFAVGDPVVGMGGWQLYQHVAAGDLGGLRKVDTNRVPSSAYLGAVGMPGVTAWYGLNKIIEPKAGQTVVVSAASGAVGGTVGQLAKVRGARTVGLAGGPDKCRYVTQELGFDACIDYKQHQDLESLSQALQEACPDGIDGHFENVGGMILDAVLLHSNSFARVALCGMISRYGSPIPITQTQHILMNRMRLEAFVVSEHMEVWPDALKELGTLAATGKLKYRETVSQGLETAPEALMGLFKGSNFGKQLVKLVQ